MGIDQQEKVQKKVQKNTSGSIPVSQFMSADAESVPITSFFNALADKLSCNPNKELVVDSPSGYEPWTLALFFSQALLNATPDQEKVSFAVTPKDNGGDTVTLSIHAYK